MDEYVYTSDDWVVEGTPESGKVYEETDFNRIIEIKEREAYRVNLFMDAIDQTEKTLVFCATQLHALVVRDLVNQIKTSSDPNYCVRVTANDGAIGDQFLREFQDNEKTIPTVLTTSQKLSTGVDARNIRNIVLMRPINSMIEFKQIIGRSFIDVGPDGTVWRDAGDEGLARLAGGEWAEWTSTDLPDIGFDLSGGLDYEFEVAPDGSVWFSAWRGTDGGPPEVDDWSSAVCDGLARFDGETLDRFLPGKCILMDIAANGSVWVLAADEAALLLHEGFIPDDQTWDLYVITPEAVAASG